MSEQGGVSEIPLSQGGVIQKVLRIQDNPFLGLTESIPRKGILLPVANTSISELKYHIFIH